MRPDGNRRRHLGRTIDPESAAWAPDGRRIAFTGFDDGRIRILNSRGHGRRLLSGPAYDLAWSPDGKRIAFARTREHGDSSCTGIYVLTVRSGAVRKITPGC